jgi:hypothetical protein
MPHEVEILDVQRHQLGSSEPSYKADQEQGTVTCIPQIAAHGVKHLDEILLQQGLRLSLTRSMFALDTPQCGSDEFRLSLIRVASGAVSL